MESAQKLLPKPAAQGEADYAVPLALMPQGCERLPSRRCSISMSARSWTPWSFGACRACPHLVDPPADRLLYKLSTGSPVERKICDACGCVASRKARLPSEGCPKADPSDPARTRWGEPPR